MAILWEQAVQTLSKEDQRAFKVDEPSPQLLQSILDSIEQQRDVCLASQTKFRGSRGREIKIRDLCNRTIAWITKFLEVGDVIAQYSPGYASLPWAGFRLLIQLGINNIDTFKAMLEGIEQVSSVISRTTIIETLYLPGTSEAHAQLEKSLLRLYTTVLEYLCKAREYYGKSSTKRMLSSMLRPSDVDGNIQAIAKEDSNVRRVLSLLDSQGQKALASSISVLDGDVSSLLKKIENLQISQDDVRSVLAARDDVTSSQVGALHSNLEDMQRREVLLWISDVPYDKHHKDLKRGFLPGSGKWLFQKKAYQTWRDSIDSKLLSLTGPSGCGKTKLMTVIIDSLQAQTNASTGKQSPALAYFYCSRNPAEPERSKPYHVLRTLVKQLCIGNTKGGIHDCVLKAFENRKSNALRNGLDPAPLDAEECTELLLQLLSKGETGIAIDALDECDPTQRHILLGALETLLKSDRGVKLLISSRDETDIGVWFQNSIYIRITERDTREDIESFAQAQVDNAVKDRRILRGQVHPQLRQEIIETLRERASGMFRWVSLQIESLRVAKSESGVMATLQHAPRSLMESYEAIHTQALGEDPEGAAVAETVFKWLLCAMRNISIKEMISILSNTNTTGISTSEELQILHIIDCCYHFVVVDEQLEILRFTHPSVREYLENEYSQSSAHLSVAKRCIQVFTIPDSPTNEELASYASLYWPFHCERIESLSDRTEAQGWLRELFFAKEYFHDWQDEMKAQLQKLSQASDIAKKLGATISTPVNPLFVIACFGLVEILSDSNAPKMAINNQFNDHGASSLYLAARWGQIDVAKYCLERGMDVNVSGGLFGSALQAASFSGHIEIVKLLLENGASALRGGEYPDAIEAAIIKGNREVAGLLLQTGYAKKGGVDHVSLLTLARFEAYPEIVDMLQENHTQSSKDASGRLPLQQALLEGKLRRVKEILNTFSDVNVVEGSFGTALQAAIFGGDLTLVKLLVDRGARIDKRGPFGYPLRASAVTGHINIVDWLLESGADCNIEDDELGDCLQAAASKGYLEIVRKLVDNKAEVDGRGGLFGTPLQAASFHGHTRIVKHLLHCGADISAPGRFRDALHAAIYGNQQHIAEVLQGHGALMNPDLISRVYQSPFAISRQREPLPDCRKLIDENFGANRLSPLELAASSGNTAMVEMLLERGAQINGSNSQFNALQIAAFYGRRVVVDLLLSKEADVNVACACLGTALNAAVQSSHWDIVKLLLSHGANINQHWTRIRQPSPLHDDFGSPLQVKCEQGDLTAVRILCDHGADLKDPGGWNGTALQVAAAEGHLEIASILIRRGANINDPGRNNGTALQAAMLNNHSDVFEMLLRENADVNTRGRSMGTALQAAAAEGLTSRVQELIRLGANVNAHQLDEEGNFASIITYQARNLGTALFLASGRGHQDIVRVLLESGADRHIPGVPPPRSTISYGDTYGSSRNAKSSDALYQASCQGNIEIASLLIANDEQAYIERGTMVEAMKAAIKNNHTELMKLLLDAGIDANLPREDLSTLLFPVIEADNEDMLDFLIKKGADVNQSYAEPRGASVHMVPYFESTKAVSGDTPLHSAARSGLSSMIETLIASDADVHALNAEADSPLSKAIQTTNPHHPNHFTPSIGRIATIQSLIEAGASVTSLSSKILVRLFKIIASNGASELLHLVHGLDTGAIPSASSEDFQCGLSLAVYHNQKNFLQTLVRLGLIPNNKQDAIYGLILSMAAAEGRIEIAKHLIEAGVPLREILARREGNPFVRACRCKQLPILQLLLTHHPNIKSEILNLALDSTRDIDVGQCILQHVKQNSMNEDYAQFDQQRVLDRNLRTAVWPLKDCALAESLINRGASVNNVNLDNEKLILLATAAGNSDMVKLLIRHGANPNEEGGNKTTHLQVALTVHGPLWTSDYLNLPFSLDPIDKEHSVWNADEFLERKGPPPDIERDPILLASIFVENDPIKTGEPAGTGRYVNAYDEPKHVTYFATALQVAAASNYPRIVQVLIDHGADVNAQGGTYGSALGVVRAKMKTHSSTKWKRVEQILLREGARE